MICTTKKLASSSAKFSVPIVSHGISLTVTKATYAQDTNVGQR